MGIAHEVTVRWLTRIQDKRQKPGLSRDTPCLNQSSSRYAPLKADHMQSTWSSNSARSICASALEGVFSAELVEERAGFVVLRVSGKGAATLFAGEPGGHRWQCVSPTDKRSRVQTSTITVAVLPEPREHEMCLRDEDVTVETMRGSGAGGQHRNKTDSAVRVTHRPTGVVVRCESERSQSQNKETAFGVLRARLAELERDRVSGARAQDRRSQIGSGMRGDKRRTVRVQDDQVNDHDGRHWSFKRYARGDWE